MVVAKRLALAATLTVVSTAGLAGGPKRPLSRPAIEGFFVGSLPRGFPTPAVPADNPMSAAKVTLGRRLFFENSLSVTGQYSCATCHQPSKAFTDGRKLAIGATGDPTPTNAMSLTNVAYNVSFGWSNPSVRSLEDQMRQPMLNDHPVEMGLKGRESAGRRHAPRRCRLALGLHRRIPRSKRPASTSISSSRPSPHSSEP